LVAVARVRFAPSPTGSLHLGSALTAWANRRFADEHGGVLVLRIDDTDPTRVEPGAEDAIRRDLDWLGVTVDEGPVRQSERRLVYDQAAETLLALGAAHEERDGGIRFALEHQPAIVRADGTPTYHLASVVDDIHLGITHVIRGKDLEPSTPIHRALAEALEARPPEYLHHGLLVGHDGTKLSKRHGAVSLAQFAARGIPVEAVRAYLDELGFPRHDVHYDEGRLQRLATDAIAGLPDEELAERLAVPVSVVPAVRGARDLSEARAYADSILVAPPASPTEAPETLARFRELRESANGHLTPAVAREIVRELKAVGGNLRALRRALTGTTSGPELWSVVVALPRDEALRRVDAAL
jgi:glutamyl/glutaminyl-tRNA synthetase